SSHTPTPPIEATQKWLWQCSEATAKPIQIGSFENLWMKEKEV
ncbi:2218_t:CDS:2, partial [Gigaspora rosea]